MNLTTFGLYLEIPTPDVGVTLARTTLRAGDCISWHEAASAVMMARWDLPSQSMVRLLFGTGRKPDDKFLLSLGYVMQGGFMDMARLLAAANGLQFVQVLQYFNSLLAPNER